MMKGITSAPKRLIAYLADLKHIHLYIMALGLLCAIIFCFVIYSSVVYELDPDRHGDIGYGILYSHTFSYYPDTQPTVERGPLYPFFIALLLLVSRHWWPYSIQLGQCIIFALMCGLVFWTTQALWSKRAAVVTGVVCAMHPVGIWFTSRVWVENMSMALFAAIIAGMVFLVQRPNTRRALLLGCAIAAACLTKGTFLPFVLVVPFMMWFLVARNERLRVTVLVLLSAVLLIAPWTVRNYMVTHRFIPVHARFGFNMETGDEIAEHWSESPLDFSPIWSYCASTLFTVQSNIPKSLPEYQKELKLDEVLLQMSKERYRKDPAFMLKKIGVNAIAFWTLGAGKDKTIAIGAMLLSLLALVLISATLIWRRRQIRTVMGAHLAIMLIYYAMHLPIEAIARYSVVLLPVIIIYGIAPIINPWLEDKR
jgi:4-amino-4-deoxy-L-arabinose transferase-like glycosyltransferase